MTRICRLQGKSLKEHVSSSQPLKNGTLFCEGSKKRTKGRLGS